MPNDNEEEDLLATYVSTIQEFLDACQVNSHDSDLSKKKKKAERALKNLDKIMQEIIKKRPVEPPAPSGEGRGMAKRIKG